MLIVLPEVIAANFVTVTALCPEVTPEKTISFPAVFFARVDDEQTVYGVKVQLVPKVIVISPSSGTSEVSSTVKVYSK
jgi:hypothetical protein